MFQKLISSGLFLPGFLLILALLFLWSRGIFNPRRPQDTLREVGEKAVNIFNGGSGFSVDENTPGYENYKQLKQGCPFRDCIPSIDQPKFESAEEADKWLEDEDVVFALEYEGVKRAYPQRILNWHEIVNDHVKLSGDKNVASEDFYFAVTFCPLCGSALTFDRTVGGQVLEFGVSGKLHNNDLVMYDRQSESLWQQITGEAIVGKMFGKKLRAIPMDTLRWSGWRSENPDTVVLSRETGFSRDYNRYPYGSYEEDTRVNFPVEGGVDDTVHPKAVVFGVEVNNSFKAYTQEALEEDSDGVIRDNVGDAELEVTYRNGELSVINLKTREELAPVRLFWFAWKAFHPETELFK